MRSRIRRALSPQRSCALTVPATTHNEQGSHGFCSHGTQSALRLHASIMLYRKHLLMSCLESLLVAFSLNFWHACASNAGVAHSQPVTAPKKARCQLQASMSRLRHNLSARCTRKTPRSLPSPQPRDGALAVPPLAFPQHGTNAHTTLATHG